jgi:hypothetical protein
MVGVMLASTRSAVGDPLTYYAVIATIIPVLFLALVYQSGVSEQFRWRSPAHYWPIFVAVVCGLAALSEGSALVVLASGHPTKGQQVTGALGVVALGLYLFGSILGEAIARLPDQRKPRWEQALVLTIVGAIVAFGVWMVVYLGPLGVLGV